MDGDCLKNDRIVIFSFTRTGTELNRLLSEKLKNTGRTCRGYTTKKYAGEEILSFPGSGKELVGSNWGSAAFLFIGAAGIAVRWIAPWLKDKFTDSPVLVMDEKGQYVIPLLSGHMGGAVSLAEEIAELTGAVPVHTTATDVQKKFAVDVFARENGLLITDRKMAKEIAAAVLEGEKIGICIQYSEYSISGGVPEELILCDTVLETEKYRYRIVIGDIPGQPGTCVAEKGSGPHRSEKAAGGTLFLKPQNVTVGIGCRKGIGAGILEKGLCEILDRNGLEIGQVERLASIDLKKEEQGILDLCKKYQIPFAVYTAEELRSVRKVTSGSEFVEQVTGVDNVCERAALLCCADGELVQGKTVRPSMTAALARRPLRIRF